MGEENSVNIYEYVSIIASILTIVSTVLSVLFFMQKRKDKQTEDTNRAILKNRLECTLQILKGSATNIQFLIRRCDDENVAKKELQSMARLARTDVYTAIQLLSDTDESLKEWNYGEMLKSSDSDKKE